MESLIKRLIKKENNNQRNKNPHEKFLERMNAGNSSILEGSVLTPTLTRTTIYLSRPKNTNRQI